MHETLATVTSVKKLQPLENNIHRRLLLTYILCKEIYS